MTRRPTNQPNRLTPVNLRSRAGPALKSPNARLSQTPTHQAQRKARPIIMENSDYSYSDLSSGNENIQVVKVANNINDKNRPALLSDYSSDGYSDHATKTNLVKYQQYSYSYSESYSDSVPLEKIKKDSIKSSKSTTSNEISYTPQNNRNQESNQVERIKFVRPNIRKINQNPNDQDLENKNEPTTQDNSSNPNNQNPHRQQIRRRLIKSNNQEPIQERNDNNDPQINQNNVNRGNINKSYSVDIKDTRKNDLSNTSNTTSNPNTSTNANTPTNTNAYNNANTSNNANIPANTNIPENNASTPLNITSGFDILKCVDPNAPFHHFILTREYGKFHKLKTHLFTDKSMVFLHSRDQKTVDRKVIHGFAGDTDLLAKNSKKDFKTFTYDDSIAFLKWNKRLTRFTLHTSQTKNNRDDRLGELIGVYIETNGQYENIQHGDSATKSFLVFTVVIPKNQAPFYPVSERLTLTELAKGGTEDMFQKRSSLTHSKKNKKDESKNEISDLNTNSGTRSKIDPRFMRLVQVDLDTIPEHELGNIFFQKSHKNFAFIDEETGKPIFLFFRSSKNSFSIKIKPPMLPLQAHALAVIILKRNMQWQFV